MRLHLQRICTSLKNWFHGIVFVQHFLKETIRWSYSYVHLELVSYVALGSNFTDSEEAFSPVCMWLREVTWGFSSSVLLLVFQKCSVFSLTQNRCLEESKNSLEGSFSIKWKKVEWSQLQY